MKPREATTEKKIIKLKEDNYPRGLSKWSVLVTSKYVLLHPPAQDRTDYVSIPRSQFNAIIDWYNRDQSPLKNRTMEKKHKLKRPTNGAINQLRIGIAMTGDVAINGPTAELILLTIAEIERLGGKYSLMDAARVKAFVDKNNRPKDTQPKQNGN